MIRDPKNEYDELAIGIYHNDIRIGWVPQEINEMISRLDGCRKSIFLPNYLSKKEKQMVKDRC